MTLARTLMVCTRLSQPERDLVDALASRRLLKQSEIIRDWVQRGIATDLAALAPTEEPHHG